MFYLRVFVPALLPEPPTLTNRSTHGLLKGWAASFLHSPITLLFAQSYVEQPLNKSIHDALQHILPRLSNGLTSTIWEPMRGVFKNGIYTSYRPRLVRLGEHIHRTRLWLMNPFTPHQTINDAAFAAALTEVRRSLLQFNTVSQPSFAPDFSSEPTSERSTTRSRGSHHNTEEHAESVSGPNIPSSILRDGTEGRIATSLQDDASSVGSPVEQPVDGVRVANHRGDPTGAVMLEVEVTTGGALRAGSLTNHVPNSATSDNATESINQRSTLNERSGSDSKWLTSYPMSSLSSHLARYLVRLITLPLENLLMRNIVTTFVDSVSKSDMVTEASIGGPQLYTLIPGVGTQALLWGQYLRDQQVPRLFVMRILQCMLLESVVSYVLYDLGYRAAVWWAIRYFRKTRASQGHARPL